MSADWLSSGLDKVGDGIGSAIQGAQDMAKSGFNSARTAVQDFHGANLRKEIVPPRAGSFNKEKYVVKQHMYPDDLMSPNYDGNYAIFYINVSDDSKLNIKENTVSLDPRTEPRLRGKLVAKNMDTVTVLEANLGAEVINTMAGGGGSQASNVIGTIGLGFAGALAPEAGRSQRRLKTAIALHIPNQLSVRYGMQWEDVDTYGIQAVADGIQSALGKQGANNKLAAVGAGAAEAIAGIALQKAPGAAGVSAALGVAGNPKKEQVFKGVDFRKFTFDYQFFPRDATEAANVIRIIHEFKLHMHPEFKSELNYVWIYPSEFDITYYTKGVENPNIHRHTSCVLENMTVNYTPNGNFSVFDNGMPTQINVSLEFKELQILSKETIEGGL